MATVARKEKRSSLSSPDVPLSPIQEEVSSRFGEPTNTPKKMGSLRRFFSTRSSKKGRMIRAATIDTPCPTDRANKIPRPRNLSFDLPTMTDDSDAGVHTASSSSAASTCSDQSYGRTISSDGILLDPISAQTKAYSLNSINSNGNTTDESDGGALRMRANAADTDEEQLKRDPRQQSKHKYFAANGDRNFIKNYFQPSFQQRSRQFKKLFSTHVPADDVMLASFSCAYQREILIHGRIFISSSHFCFYANLLGWVTTFAIPMKDVAEITKEKVVLIFPNSVQLTSTNGQRFFFASFANREKSMKVMRTAWSAVQGDGNPLTPDELWEVMNPEKENADKEKRKKNGSASSADEPMLKTLSAPSLEPGEQRAAAGACAAADAESDAAERSSTSSTTELSMAECVCEQHGGRKVLDHVFPLSVSELYELCFTSNPWFVQLNSALQRTAYAKMPKNYTGYSASDWATDKDGVRNRTCTYTMALNQAMAPKSCVVTEKQVYRGFTGGFTVLKETQNAGVPYGDSFVVQVTYCVSEYGKGQARLMVHGELVFRKSVWSVIKGYIEKPTDQGLDDHYGALFAALTEECKRQAAGAESSLRTEEDQNRMDTSSEEGCEENGINPGMRGMAGSISGINFVHNAGAAAAAAAADGRGLVGYDEPTFTIPLLGPIRRVDFYGIGIMSLLALLCFSLFLLVGRLPSTPAQSRIADVFDRYLSAAPAAGGAAQPDLDQLIAAINKIGAQLQQVRDAAGRAEL